MELNLEKLNELNRGKLSDFLGIRIVESTPEKITATMPVTEKHQQAMGILHGGASVALAETVASVGGWAQVADRGQVVVGQEINANHLKQARSGTLTAEGVPLHLGKSSQVWEIKIFDDSRNLICISRCTLAVITPRI